MLYLFLFCLREAFEDFLLWLEQMKKETTASSVSLLRFTLKERNITCKSCLRAWCQLGMSIIVVLSIYKNKHLLSNTIAHPMFLFFQLEPRGSRSLDQEPSRQRGGTEGKTCSGWNQCNEGGGSCLKICIRIMNSIFVIIMVVIMITIVIRHKERRVRCWTPS